MFSSVIWSRALAIALGATIRVYPGSVKLDSNSCLVLAPNTVFVFALAALLGLALGSCSGKRGTKTAAQPRPAEQEDAHKPTAPSTPIVRLDPPVMEEPKNDAPEGELLRLRLSRGYQETRVFEGQAQLRFVGGEPVTQRINMRVSATVEAVDGDVYAIRLEPSPITVDQPGQAGQSGLLTEEPAIVDVDTRGRLLTPTNALVSTLQTIGFVPLPEKRVAPGAKWSLSGQRSWPLLGDVSVRETFTYHGVAKLDGRKVHRIDHSVKGSISSIDTNATYYLDAETGTLLRGEVHMSGKVDLPNQDGAKAPAEVDIRLTIRNLRHTR